MKYYSTNKQVPEVSFEKAIFQGLPDDNGLYMPKTITQLPRAFFENIHDMELHDIAYEVAKCYIEDEIPEEELRKIVAGTLSFDLPLVEVEDNVYALELYHGPTCAFKDVGARFLARCLSYFSRQSDKKATILVATSGDTGSAVASGFLGMKNINVVILYPKGKISKIQEQQLTTLGENITACEVEGTFDDCQKMVKDAFLNLELKEKYNLTSANSINMARLVPQSFYYFWTYAMLGGDKDLYISVPSGNYGNLTAGLLAKKMGLPIKQYIASANANDIVPAYLRSGNFEPRRSVETISNAMDVGNPSNFYRMNDLFGAEVDNFRNELKGYTYSDEQTADTIKQVYGDTGYLLDPHGAVGYLGLKEYMKDHDGIGVFLETAHPAKFLDVVEPIIDEKVEIPQRLQDYIEREKVAIEINADLGQLESILEKL
ncbi:threonine synthase [Reichenbachiella carrageenanivorans]|uniref:Threonine synthase n=1 Tax=Reichenbachiella carrageenanivorans TaxID=2979869 RepID=A0ABY6CZ83_9BACT|nr:threonine synthase [Reichenbachiella carrageenanivorans]UXX79227.1 threonine synthase [Reichenbachiella carrageenanivorans]